MSQLMLFGDPARRRRHRKKLFDREAKSPKQTIEQRLWSLLDGLLSETDTTLHITTILDEHGPMFSAWVIRDGGYRRKHASAQTLAAIVEQLSEEKLFRQCGKCKRVKPLDGYSKDVSQTDGINRVCKQCERVRVANYAERQARKA